ncbi:class I SAM-dependent methyltransferase [Kineosporia sp. J2-2]|uniref:Class I SAM-dependent methyltransferase n=1 Tax=Kineosporia corallincola TaxID=2835133 RepID=A0ABS5TMN3_9ACTN|nr:class I SAM-dependent methyltransferase [Kineosporia corallincola]MBT0772350.1 class I SAM-dependent methyltransferase [Kineosporia corallincola]
MTSVVDGPEFRSAVAGLEVPGMGTEVVGPFLANLVALLRPERVLEVGMGYTTPFLAGALADQRRLAAAEESALAAKTSHHLARSGELGEEWLLDRPPLLAPASYLEPYRPSLVAIDNLSIEESSAARTSEVLARLGLDDLVAVVNADLRDSIGLLPAGFGPIDLAWVDAWECLWFFDHFWDLINPDGGLVVMHYLMTYPEGEAVLHYIDEVRKAHPGELEVLNLLESQKLMQNSVTILRRTSGQVERRYAGKGGEVRFTPELQQQARQQVEVARRRG